METFGKIVLNNTVYRQLNGQFCPFYDTTIIQFAGIPKLASIIIFVLFENVS
jgi:hypothetical protein